MSFIQYSFRLLIFFLTICWLTDNFPIISKHALTSSSAGSHGTIFSVSVPQKNVCSLTNIRPTAYPMQILKAGRLGTDFNLSFWISSCKKQPQIGKTQVKYIFFILPSKCYANEIYHWKAKLICYIVFQTIFLYLLYL